MSESSIKVVARNRRARHDYHLNDEIEAGMVLTGTEIKSIRNSKADLKRAFARIHNGEVWLYDLHISPYEQGNRENHEPERPRKLLLHKKQIVKLQRALQEKGVTLIPTKLYLKNGRAKIEIAVAHGKKTFDKRQDIAKRDANRQIERALKQKYA